MNDLKTRYPMGSMWKWKNGAISIVLGHKDLTETYPLVVANNVTGRWVVDSVGPQLDMVADRVEPPEEETKSRDNRDDSALWEIADHYGINALIVLSPEQYGNLFAGAHDRVGEVAVVHIVD